MSKKTNIKLPKDIRRWFEGLGEKFFKKIELKKGFHVLDFGARVGNYSIPAAKVVGSKGKIHALDKNHSALNDLMKRAQAFQVEKNINLIKTSGELKIPLEAESIDIILFLDVIRSLCKKNLQPYRELLVEFTRILKTSGQLILLLEHVEQLPFTIQDIHNETKKHLTFKNNQEITLTHWNHLKKSTINIYKKS